jgi:predicted PurR-regulated permease PerM
VKTLTDASRSGRSRLRRLINALTVLAFVAIGSVALYAISLILTAVIILLLSALFDYFIYPLMQFFQRRLPQPLAIVVTFLLVAGIPAVVMLIVTSSINPQVASLAKFIQFLMSPAGERWMQSFIAFLGQFGITVEVHPIVAIFALFAGAELFGLLGVPRYPYGWRPSADRCGNLAQMGTQASRKIPTRRGTHTTNSVVARTKGHS